MGTRFTSTALTTFSAQTRGISLPLRMITALANCIYTEMTNYSQPTLPIRPSLERNPKCGWQQDLTIPDGSKPASRVINCTTTPSVSARSKRTSFGVKTVVCFSLGDCIILLERFIFFTCTIR